MRLEGTLFITTHIITNSFLFKKKNSLLNYDFSYRLADHLEQEPERQRAQREKVKKKIEEGLREPSTKKHRFDDTAYLKASEEMKEKVQNTVAEGIVYYSF